MFEGADETDTAAGTTESPRRSGLSGAVDWRLAARTGAALVPAGPRTSRYSAEQVVAELAASSIRAEGPVREVSGLLDDQPVPEARIVDRPGWISAAADSMSTLTGTGAQADTGFKGRLAGKPAGVQAGAMLAFLSTAILGQYDPFTGPDGTLLLVAPNIMAVERALGVSPTDFRFWVCLHEVTHRVQFSSAPWLADYMRSNVDVLGEVGEEPLAEMLSRLVAEVRERRRGGVPDDPANRGVIGLLRATQAPPQREALDRLLMLGTLLEGHADHVMDAVGPAVIPTVAQIRAAFDKRRQRPANPIQRILRALLGVDAKVAQYVRGKAFVDHVVGRVGMASFNTVWTDAETLPRTDEIEDPDRWIARVLN
ncbi:zinc-dependent metalloprotease [Nocardia farcinica]|uniref:Hydrolase n=4 Tax=Nocardia TaxID=1817 RepID=Q5Z2W2_NOCFA|nr:zinc-dependent metalloprotease [Nocardia farcinica]AXK86851.1 hydrolase [Nocardia farcinica]MBA4855595.1 zinc-dependent metalloprotease [Nocardia farcinica]MBC9817336.1 zinc-dependent metalloprotease [Nocardia farcinica]MBF6234288.1 zinc-dependent metalloprotease [Nocardia farcinica]MBF6251998.1 zinc-dependent metalloprotease [Nocardia farcinica]